MALPSIDHLTLSEAHARVKKDLKACVAQPRGLGGFIYQPLALRSKPSEDNARIKRGQSNPKNSSVFLSNFTGRVFQTHFVGFLRICSQLRGEVLEF